MPKESRPACAFVCTLSCHKQFQLTHQRLLLPYSVGGTTDTSHNVELQKQNQLREYARGHDRRFCSDLRDYVNAQLFSPCRQTFRLHVVTIAFFPPWCRAERGQIQSHHCQRAVFLRFYDFFKGGGHKRGHDSYSGANHIISQRSALNR